MGRNDKREHIKGVAMGEVQPSAQWDGLFEGSLKTIIKPTQGPAGFLFSPRASVLNSTSDEVHLRKKNSVGLSQQLL